MSYYPTFRDFKRTIDYILVYKVSALIKEAAAKQHASFLDALQVLGLQMETETFSVDEDIVFIKLHASEGFVSTYAGLFDIELACESFKFRPYIKPPRPYLATPLTNPNINDPIYTRAPETMSGEIPKKITSAERILITHQVLIRCVWGEERDEYGISKLIRNKIFVDAYPLHDGQYKWTGSGPLNDRQLLALYWGSAKCWKKAQPLNLIEKYFGTEYGLYFAWLGMYVKHLIPAAVLSFFVLAYGIMTIPTESNSHAHEICKSDRVMCPKCHFSQCAMEMLSNSCYIANVAYVFDNWCGVVFAAVMSLWSTVFIEFWQREEAVLQLQWNVKSLKHSMSLRPEFLQKAVKKKYSPVTGKMEPYIPKLEQTCRYVLSLASVILLLVIMILAYFSVMIYRSAVNLLLSHEGPQRIIKSRFNRIFASVTGALISGSFIFIFKALYKNIAENLTNMETHRTVYAYTNSYIYKCYALEFANNYAPVFYVAFFKGKFYTYPGDMEQANFLGGINADTCDTTGCTVDLAILLMTIMVLKALVNNVSQILVPKLQNRYNKTLCKVKDRQIPQWEEEYLLAKTEEFFMIKEYMDMIIQYGFVNFFIMGFPLAPVLALLNNVCELRVDAFKLITSYRRPIPLKAAGLGAWMGILTATTYIGVVTNALVVAFTSSFIEQVIWKILKGSSAESYMSQILSEFDMHDFLVLDGNQEYPRLNVTRYCYYQGKRYGPNHPLKYTRRKDFWQNLGLKFAAVVLFEHIVILLKGIIAYAIPDVPYSVTQQVMYQEKIAKRAKMLEITGQYMKERENTRRKQQEERHQHMLSGYK